MIAKDPEQTFKFTFDDFKVTQNTDCAKTYVQQYSLYLAGVDVSASLPNWITNFNSEIPEFSIYSLKPTDEGIFTITVKAVLLMNPTQRVAETQIDFKFELIVDPCL